MLAVAVAVARRESLPLPVPVSNRFPHVAESREDDWQELIVSHLGISDWLRLDFRDELDCVGRYARAQLRRHGLLWPFNVHFHAPIVEAAAGGSILTGIGGDESLGESRWHPVLDILTGRARPGLRDLRRLAHFAAPATLRAARFRRRAPLRYDWLTAEATRELVRLWASQAAGEPRLPRRHALWRSSFRYLRVGAASLARIGAESDVELVHPFLGREFRSALASGTSRVRFRSRIAMMEDLFGARLPAGIVTRSTKSSFDGAFFGSDSRAFAEAWQGDGIDAAFVDADALRAEWLSPAPDPRSYLLLQAAWLDQDSPRQGAKEKLRGRLEGGPISRAAQLETRQ